jgi:hypothetical protein
VGARFEDAENELQHILHGLRGPKISPAGGLSVHDGVVKVAALLGFCLLLLQCSDKKQESNPFYDLAEGDIVFQGNPGEANDAIRTATDSPFTHCGVVLRIDGEWMVLEAVQPVRLTPVGAFRQRSLPGTYRAMRLARPVDADALHAAREWGRRQKGRNYDFHFRWEDGALYCSELVWKFYREAGVEICPLREFHDYRLEHPGVRRWVERRYGSPERLPKGEAVVSPGDLAASSLLVEAPLRH